MSEGRRQTNFCLRFFLIFLGEINLFFYLCNTNLNQRVSYGNLQFRGNSEGD